MSVPTSEVGYTSAMPRREDHEVHKDMWGHWRGGRNITNIYIYMYIYLYEYVCVINYKIFRPIGTLWLYITGKFNVKS